MGMFIANVVCDIPHPSDSQPNPTTRLCCKPHILRWSPKPISRASPTISCFSPAPPRCAVLAPAHATALPPSLPRQAPSPPVSSDAPIVGSCIYPDPGEASTGLPMLS